MLFLNDAANSYFFMFWVIFGAVEDARFRNLDFLLVLAGISASSGSACTSGSLEPSHVLLATGQSAEIAQSSVRFSIGYTNTKEDVDYLLSVIVPLVEKLRELSSVSV